MTTTQSIRGYFAVEMWLNNIEGPMVIPFAEAYQSDYKSFTIESDAIERAQELAREMGLQYLP